MITTLPPSRGHYSKPTTRVPVSVIVYAIYVIGAFLVGAVTFIGSWLYAASRFGWFIGIGLGWFPAGVIGVIVGVLWPVIALLAIAMFLA